MSNFFLLILCFQFIVENKFRSDSVLCSQKTRESQQRPVLVFGIVFVMFLVAKEILCTCNSLVSIFLQLLNLRSHLAASCCQDIE